jgi:hypothetical protein
MWRRMGEWRYSFTLNIGTRLKWGVNILPWRFISTEVAALDHENPVIVLGDPHQMQAHRYLYPNRSVKSYARKFQGVVIDSMLFDIKMNKRRNWMQKYHWIELL